MVEVGFNIFQSKKYDDAIKILEFNSTLYPDSWRNLETLGEAYLGKDDKAKAKECFEKSLSFNPRNRRLQQTLDKLK